VVRDTSFCDDACVYEVSLNYLHPFRSCGPENEKAIFTFDRY